MNMRVRILAIASGIFLTTLTSYGWYMRDRIMPRTYVGSVAVGGMTQEQALARLDSATAQFQAQGVPLNIEGSIETLHPDDIGFDIDTDQVVQTAFSRGHMGTKLANIWDHVAFLWSPTRTVAPVHVDDLQFRAEIGRLLASHESARQDVRLVVRSEERRV